MKKRYLFEKWRHWIQACWFALTNGYIRGYTTGKIYTGNTKVLCVPGLNCYSCPGAIGSCPIGSLQAILGGNTYRISLYVFGFITLFGVFFGRMICGFLCPFGFFQDLLYKIPFPYKKKNLPGHKYLKYLRYVIFIVFVVLLTSLVKDVTGTGSPWFCEWICPSGTLLAGIPLVSLNPEFQAAIGFQFFWKVGILIIILLSSIVYYRPFCKYLCPLGAIYGVFNPVSTYRLEVDPNKCVKCGSCQRACGMDIKTYETPNSPDCIRCLKCVSACPADALDTSWNKARKKWDAKFAPNEEVVPNTLPVRTTLLAILTIVAGLACVITTYTLALNSAFANHLAALTGVSETIVYTIFSIAKGLVSIFLVATGISLLMNRNDMNALTRFKEQMSLIFKIWVISVVLYIVGMIFNLPLLGQSINILIYAPFLPIGLFFLNLLAKLTEKQATQHKGSSILWWLLFVIVAIIALYNAFIAIYTLVGRFLK